MPLFDYSTNSITGSQKQAKAAGGRRTTSGRPGAGCCTPPTVLNNVTTVRLPRRLAESSPPVPTAHARERLRRPDQRFLSLPVMSLCVQAYFTIDWFQCYRSARTTRPPLGAGDVT
ncbi:hypothetical protein EVAR_24128_1 [Eumeta japonica]|uniref:Uncharacterized protein n=1 Tax=Eumeta variegata TaxID=151549 RepID=A0A4C1YLV3_EUMVA|nr:hypothetical protein EVAR_24128_1 [Eumeta japonica]